MPLLPENIGFPMGGVYGYWNLQVQTLKFGNPVQTPGGLYYWYTPGAGIEVWSKEVAEGEICNLYAHFAGETRIRVALVEKRPCRDDALADGLFVAYFKHKEGEGLETVHERLRYGDGTYTGVIPFVFSVPNYDWYSSVKMPIVTDVQITAFPFTLTGYETEDDWIEYQLERDRQARGPDEEEEDDPGFYAGASFIPLAALFEKKSPEDFPPPTAILSGIVLETAILTNPVTGQDFSWARIETAAGDMDLVVTPEVIEGYVVEGGVVAGRCYISGRLPEFAPDV
ncbi:MAG: hypothetical protein QOC96_718 [Acidobacteriota bacterium]|jgi:hypothetical protein|nr:hypothetical protein [Acidobacteriota bacterium]